MCFYVVFYPVIINILLSEVDFFLLFLRNLVIKQESLCDLAQIDLESKYDFL